MKIQPNWNIEEDHNPERGTSLIGKVVYCHCQEPMRNLSYALSTAHIIGWNGAKNKKDEGYYTFVSLADGMTGNYNLKELINILNAQPYVPIPSSILAAIMLEKQPLK
jgi:hypothetical protein